MTTISELNTERLADLDRAETAARECLNALGDAAAKTRAIGDQIEARGGSRGNLADSALKVRVADAIGALFRGHIHLAVEPNFPAGRSWAGAEDEATQKYTS